MNTVSDRSTKTFDPHKYFQVHTSINAPEHQRNYVRRVDGYDPSKSGGYAFVGEFLSGVIEHQVEKPYIYYNANNDSPMYVLYKIRDVYFTVDIISTYTGQRDWATRVYSMIRNNFTEDQVPIMYGAGAEPKAPNKPKRFDGSEDEQPKKKQLPGYVKGVSTPADIPDYIIIGEAVRRGLHIEILERAISHEK